MVKPPLINILYVDSSTNNIFSISYNRLANSYVLVLLSSLPNKSLVFLASQLTTATMTKWNRTNTSLTAIQEAEPEYLEIYYIGTDSEIHGFYGNPGEAFPPKSDQSPHWDVLDTQGPGAIAGIGWSDRVRLYYITGGKVVQTALSNATWVSAANL
ncbi:uncharacterized protein K444DRAFT_432268 [Hyaloscypha bicolor E]|uniref:Fucose-specific lectin n=1 Tax=Hyaloscypha bicolor E TaxID=1095630 RepID=A0A2J6T640_9HELO|nr:uncharacterized protein K444DRAFT_432268 [Hyaloscypha bicolor E]PMD58423.1 hypothetical protein K444DRAFT_432268 [Hyaloscypha bicolor E]